MNPQNPVILCVDDEEANLKLLEKLLVPRGYTVISAASGKDALQKIKNQKIDLVLLDILMPVMDGFEVCRQIKEDQKLRSIPVIMVTALTDKKDRIRGIEAGAEEFLSKPFDLAEVLARIKILLKMKGLDDERKRAEEALQKSHDELDSQVQERTAELVQANEMLQADITERKRIEEQVVRAARDWQQTFDATNDAIWILDKDQRILRSNRNKIMEFFFNQLPENLIGKYCWEIVHGSTRPISECPFLRAQISLHRERMELQIGAGWFEITVDPITDAAGQYSGAVHIITDISERRLVEAQKIEALKALKISEENYRCSLEDSPLGVRIATAKGETIYANKALLDIYGYANVEELNKIPLKERYTPQSYAEFRIRKKARDQGDSGPSVYEINIVRKNKEIRHLQVLRKEIIWNGIKKFQVIFQDITERKQAEEKIRNSLVEKEVLLKEVHHRVKNNLMTIIGLIKMQETKADNKMFNPLLQELEGRIRAMAQVHESLHKSKDLAHIDLQDYIETMSAQIHAQFGADRDVRFKVQAAGVELGLDIAIPCGLIMNELITNAYKHAFPGDKPRAGEDNCEIKVIVEQEGGVLTLTVANNGVGLPVDLDLEKTDTLGLRLVKMLSKQINGSIELDRSAGTAFRLKFPMAAK